MSFRLVAGESNMGILRPPKCVYNTYDTAKSSIPQAIISC